MPPGFGPAPALTGTPRPAGSGATDGLGPRTSRGPAPEFRDPARARGPHSGTVRPSPRGCPAVSSQPPPAAASVLPGQRPGAARRHPSLAAQRCERPASAAPGRGHPPRGDRKPGWQRAAFSPRGCNGCVARASTFAERKLGFFFFFRGLGSSTLHPRSSHSPRNTASPLSFPLSLHSTHLLPTSFPLHHVSYKLLCS